MKIFFKKIISWFILFTIFIIPFPTIAYEINSQYLIPKALIYLSPQTGNYYVGDNFDIPIYINTRGYSINVVNIKINFDASKIQVINPSGGPSVLNVWLETPNFDNNNGTISLIGMIPNGLVTNNGLIGIISFKAINPGQANVSLTDFTTANLNDGFGTNVGLNLGNGKYNIYNQIPKEEISKETIEVEPDITQIPEPIILEHFVLEGLIKEKESTEQTKIETKEEVSDTTNFKKFIEKNSFIIFLIICLLIISLMIHYLLGRYFYQKNTENKILHDGYHSKDAIEVDENNPQKPL